MNIDVLGRVTFSSQDLINEIYRGNLDKIANVNVDSNDESYIQYLNFLLTNSILDWPIPNIDESDDINQKTFDKQNQENWFMPEEYKTIDIENLLINLCKTKDEVNRVSMEIELFKNYNMLNVLKFLKYLVDKLRKNNILWGVGRGSSVASYCLYLLGVHKIDSIKYNLDIKEFLK